MDNKTFEKRMYVFVERHLSPIDKGIQATHAVTEFYNDSKIWNKKVDLKKFDEWCAFDKTLILLDGGIVKNLDEIVDNFQTNNIHCGVFREPDLDNIVTAVAVLVDERVYNIKHYYTDFSEYVDDVYNGVAYIEEDSETVYNNYLTVIGGEKNSILKTLINHTKLAK